MKQIRCGILAGSSSLVAEIRDFVRIVSRLSGPLLLMGERGGGKERVARLIHERSAAGSRSFEVIDCSLFFADEFEHSLFEPGSLNRPGGGACYLANCEELSPRLQERLAEHLEASELVCRAARGRQEAGVRVMFSSARRLASLVAAGLFSRRLYDLLSDSTLLLPPLRRRIRDLGCLVDHQVSKFATGKETVVFSPESYGALVTYPWPGNYQQLEDELRKLLRAADAKIELDNLPASIASFWTGGAERPDVRRVHEQLTESMEEYKILALLDAEFGNLLLTSGEWGDGSVKPGSTGPVR